MGRMQIIDEDVNHIHEVPVKPHARQKDIMTIYNYSSPLRQKLPDLFLYTDPQCINIDYTENIADRGVFPSYVTTSPFSPAHQIIYCALLNKLNWTKVYLLYDTDSNSFNAFIAQLLPVRIPANCAVQLTRQQFTSSFSNVSEQLQPILRDFNLKSRELYHFLPSSRKIQKNLAEKGINVSYRTILRVIKSEKEEDIPSKKEVKNVNKRGLPFIRSDSLIKKVVKAIDTPNPSTQREISCKLGISTGTVSRVLKEDLGLTYHKKVTTHVLTPKQAQQRLDRGPTFYAVSAVENFL
ncbi:hypothetical protein BV898_18825 [Hypsibius exemplaris]|uniref:Receptor ligand binding region domain-containing protein n=1 Tax=Hypsibius exemplaris TaxID=2072580 RepID=A0A9X6NKC2_HYPEX|nr:hypothetical protein BV898_18825 [Hypsibius exemplaris]